MNTPSNTNLSECTDLPTLLNAFGLPPDTPAELGAMPGCFSAEVEAAVYHSTQNTISHSGLIHLLRSPQHYRVYLDAPEDNGKPNFGTAVHSAVLEPTNFNRDYTVFLGSRRGAAWTQFEQENDGKYILTGVEMEAVLGIKKSVHSFEDYPLKQALELGESEKSIFWIDPETGVQCRIRTDSLNPAVIFDLKTTSDARPEGILHQTVRMGYDLEAGMYSEGVTRFKGQSLPFIFIFVEDKAPYGVWMHSAGESMIENGSRKFRKGVRAFKQLIDTNNWHGYRNAISTLELPKYAMLSPESIDDATNN